MIHGMIIAAVIIHHYGIRLICNFPFTKIWNCPI
nr:MAG TPA: hypothetical protein [Caudoviricetes sp.]